MELQELHDKLFSEGCNNFYIEGIGGTPGSEYVLAERNGNWEIFYSERGVDSPPQYSTPDKYAAIDEYYNFILHHIEHWHIVVFTQSKEILDEYTRKLAEHQIKTIQNDMGYYRSQDEYVYRLFVVNKDIFRAKELFETVPYFDEGLKK